MAPPLRGFYAILVGMERESERRSDLTKVARREGIGEMPRKMAE